MPLQFLNRDLPMRGVVDKLGVHKIVPRDEIAESSRGLGAPQVVCGISAAVEQEFIMEGIIVAWKAWSNVRRVSHTTFSWEGSTVDGLT
jgi:hypothetical protein